MRRNISDTNEKDGNQKGQLTQDTNNQEASSAPNIPPRTPAFVTPRPDTTRSPAFVTPHNLANNGEGPYANQVPVHSQFHTIHAPQAVTPDHPDSIYNRHADERFTRLAQTDTGLDDFRTATDMLYQDGALRQYCLIHTPQEILSLYQTLSPSHQVSFWQQITGAINLAPTITLDKELFMHLYDRIPADHGALGLTACVHRYGLSLWTSRFNLFSPGLQQDTIIAIKSELADAAAAERMSP